MGANLSFPTVELAGRVAIVTGSNTGTGYETGKALARMGAKVVLACRSQERAEQVSDTTSTHSCREHIIFSLLIISLY